MNYNLTIQYLAINNIYTVYPMHLCHTCHKCEEILHSESGFHIGGKEFALVFWCINIVSRRLKKS